MAVPSYIEVEWVDGSAPAINAVNLKTAEAGITAVTNAVQVLENNPYTLPAATAANLGGVKVTVTNNGDGTFTGAIFTA